ncbi:Sugar lactone lactonase YvrE [Mesorhizobium albiziae]|uniref:Sugar lactone lactonase YvrE n=1 Tax=Neomesorhizobium albiziae TaxID=335020 RepID=A0A1I4E5V4_9HYPH|nr:SMP-30/gluconolactonase/LRE family protein [Mesorhizobium albiziae]GLS32494.1 gluconolactonase [Mesorhizobium albiziae]SFL00320.1 Sugar lactone lactonase YvrE [Mesorhizobium albiziae]
MAHADVTIFRNRRDVVGEGPVWDDDARCLWWVDTVGKTIHRADPLNDNTETYAVPQPPAALALADDGALIVAAGLAWLRFEPGFAALAQHAIWRQQPASMRFNDGVVDARGRFWTGTLHEAREPVGELLCLDEAEVRCVVNGLRTQNGCAISPDSRTFYLADSHPHVCAIWAFDFDLERGDLANRRLFHRPSHGRPDGAAVDSDGCYWFAAVDGGRIVRLDPDGAEMSAVKLPVSRPTKPVFGGSDLSTIYVTSMSAGTDPAVEPMAGAVLAIETGVRGLRQPRVNNSPAKARPLAGASQTADPIGRKRK